MSVQGRPVTVITTGTVLPAHAKAPANAAEQFLFDRAYETLVRADCRGRIVPQLAQRWTRNTDGFTFVLRGDARFWNGAPVTAADVIASWRASPSARVRALVDSSSAGNERTLSIATADSSVARFAAAGTAVTRESAERWPMGTGRYGIVESGGAVVLEPTFPTAARIEIRTATGVAARDAIDAGADVVLSGDPSILSYALRDTSRTAVDLEWDRTWALLVPGDATEDQSIATLRASLANDAVRAIARPAAAPDGINDDASCPERAAPPRTPKRIAYSADDVIARAIVERLVAVGRGSAAAPLAPAAFATAVRDGTESAFVVGMPYHADRRCTTAALVPLIDARWQMVVRKRP